MLTDHAKQRMSDRGVSSDDIEVVLENYHTSLPGNPKGRTVLIGNVRGRDLRVIIVTGSNPALVVTVTLRDEG
jgi:hypothetical protein